MLMRYSLHHVTSSVHDMQGSIRFYESFGFRVIVHHKEPDGSIEIAHLRLEGAILEIFWYSNRADAPTSAAELATDLPCVGVKHFALQVESIDEAKRFVEARGITENVTVQDGRTGIRYFFIKDRTAICLRSWRTRFKTPAEVLEKALMEAADTLTA